MYKTFFYPVQRSQNYARLAFLLTFTEFLVTIGLPSRKQVWQIGRTIANSAFFASMASKKTSGDPQW
jgi:hypothetical protein